ncbi:MAG: pyridoxal-phosphate dependent enzyme [Ardenticatenaceae bacterium]|nr:pyridoxal-phosphate dependent enzyme [Ardenticatenaceae bacterium]
MAENTVSEVSSTLVCALCGAVPDLAQAWRCPVCGGPLELRGLPPFDPQAIDREAATIWRYRAMLPVNPPGGRILSLGEGFSPLIPTVVQGQLCLVKVEYLMPTASYKDRGTAVMVNHLLALGVGEVVEDSSGNAGASLAAYAAAAGIRARIFVPAYAAPGKKRQISIFGAELVPVEGPRQATTEACLRAAETSFYASHAWSPYFLLGQTTFGWEVWEQLDRRVPDAILFPVGQGSLLLGAYRAFVALRQAGLVARLPRLYAVQAEACDPVVRAWERGEDVPAVERTGQTVAEGILIKAPIRGRELMQALRESGGGALAVTEAAIGKATGALAHRGLFVEPTSAVPVAALPDVRALLGPEAEIVVPLTGSGLKGVSGA